MASHLQASNASIKLEDTGKLLDLHFSRRFGQKCPKSSETGARRRVSSPKNIPEYWDKASKRGLCSAQSWNSPAVLLLELQKCSDSDFGFLNSGTAAETISGERRTEAASHPQPCVHWLRVSTDDFVTIWRFLSLGDGPARSSSFAHEEDACERKVLKEEWSHDLFNLPQICSNFNDSFMVNPGQNWDVIKGSMAVS
jgi:hypothetical protein